MVICTVSHDLNSQLLTSYYASPPGLVLLDWDRTAASPCSFQRPCRARTASSSPPTRRHPRCCRPPGRTRSRRSRSRAPLLRRPHRERRPPAHEQRHVSGQPVLLHPPHLLHIQLVDVEAAQRRHVIEEVAVVVFTVIVIVIVGAEELGVEVTLPSNSSGGERGPDEEHLGPASTR
ncbi:hypothetical protein SEVIR_5G355601v4 [Setaria viridis]